MLQNSVHKSRTAKEDQNLFSPLFAMVCIFFYINYVQKKKKKILHDKTTNSIVSLCTVYKLTGIFSFVCLFKIFFLQICHLEATKPNNISSFPVSDR